MGITDFGIGEVGSWWTGDSPTGVGYGAFGTGSIEFVGSEMFLQNEVVRNSVTWRRATNTNPEYTFLMGTLDGNGSEIGELGLVKGSAAAGSDLISYDISAIGDKNNTFSVTIKGEIRISRPF